MITAKIYISLKKSVLDPKGKTVKETLHSQGYEDVQDVRVSKFIKIEFDSDNIEETTVKVEKICDKILANPNIETYEYQLEG